MEGPHGQSGGAGQATGRAVAKGAVAAGKDFGKYGIGQPCVMGTIGDYVVVNGALITMAGLGVFASVASCATVIGCVEGGTLGFGGAGAAGYGLYANNRAFWLVVPVLGGDGTVVESCPRTRQRRWPGAAVPEHTSRHRTGHRARMVTRGRPRGNGPVMRAP